MSWLLVLVPLVEGAAAADDAAQARVHFDSAVRRYKIGRYREALADFQAAYLLHADPVLLYNVGQCHRLLGERENALRAYRQFLRDQPAAANRGDVEQLVAELEAQLGIGPGASIPSVPPTSPSSPVRGPPNPPPGPAVAPALPTPLPSPAASAALAIPPAPAAAAGGAGRPAPDREGSPVYKRWWFWTAIVGVVAAGTAVGLGVGLSQQGEPTVLVSAR